MKFFQPLLSAIAAVLLLSGCGKTPPPVVVDAPAGPPPEIQTLMLEMLDALEHGNFQVFLSRGTDQFRDTLDHRAFQSVYHQLSPRMQNGYQPLYWGKLRQPPFDVHVWRLTFSDQGTEFQLRLTTEGNKAAGIVFQ